jgi:branched-chain amino acid transport system substrate-binding protein
VSEFGSTISRIQRAEPDWLMMYITGQNHSDHYPQAYAAGVRYPMRSSISMAPGSDPS